MHRYLKLAIDQANNHEYEPNMEHGHAAVLVKGGNVLSIGFNKINTNGFMEHFARRTKGPRIFCLSIHAECDAIYSARSKTDLIGCKIYVARRRAPNSTFGKVGMSRPCAICEAVLRSYGIKKAFYTITDNEYGVMDIKKQSDEIVNF